MLSDMVNIPLWAWAVIAFLFLSFCALAWGVVKASALWSRAEEMEREDAARYNEDNARAFARRRQA